MTEKKDYQKMGLICGIEIHQQVDTKKLRRNSPYASIRVSYHPEQMGNGEKLVRYAKGRCSFWPSNLALASKDVAVYFYGALGHSYN